MAKSKRVTRRRSKGSVRPKQQRGRPTAGKKALRKKAAAKPSAQARRARPSAKTAARPPKNAAATRTPAKTPRLDRVRRRLDEDAPIQTPPSSLDMDRHGSAVRTGRAEIQASLRKHRGMSPSIRGGDVDVNVQDAYFTGDEAPGGDNPAPDQEVVDEIGKALGVHYEDHEELRGSDKIVERDKHRWERDPASAEDYTKRR